MAAEVTREPAEDLEEKYEPDERPTFVKLNRAQRRQRQQGYPGEKFRSHRKPRPHGSGARRRP